MIDTKKLLAKILVKLQFKPQLLWNSKVSSADVSSTYTYAYLDGMSNYNIIAVHFIVNNVEQLVYFVRPLRPSITFSDYFPASGYWKGSVTVDWENGGVGVRCLNAGTAGTQTDLVYYNTVYGIG